MSIIPDYEPPTRPILTQCQERAYVAIRRAQTIMRFNRIIVLVERHLDQASIYTETEAWAWLLEQAVGFRDSLIARSHHEQT